MIEVKIREVTRNTTITGPMGMQLNQPYNYLQLYFSESGEVVPDDIYTLKQGKREEMCSVYDGQARGIEWVDRNQAAFLIKNL